MDATTTSEWSEMQPTDESSEVPGATKPSQKKRRRTRKKAPKVATKKKARVKKGGRGKAASAVSRGNFPRHSVARALRIPRAILEQNAGRACTQREAASFLGVKVTGPFGVEMSSALKYGWLERVEGKISPSELAKRAIRPQGPTDELDALREAVMHAPEISEVYRHYRGENLPDEKFLRNTVTDTFKVPTDKFGEFHQVFLESLDSAKLLERHGDKIRVLDASGEESSQPERDARIERLGRSVTISGSDTCFIMQPFKAPHGDYYEKVYRPAAEKAGLQPVRADADIFCTGKIIDQIWSGINAAKVLVAELTTRNPNVFYELGLAHALRKPVVLVSSNEDDVPFDLQHIRVIYYDMADPFWGTKLIDKVAENILSAIKNPSEAILPRVIEHS